MNRGDAKAAYFALTEDLAKDSMELLARDCAGNVSEPLNVPYEHTSIYQDGAIRSSASIELSVAPDTMTELPVRVECFMPQGEHLRVYLTHVDSGRIVPVDYERHGAGITAQDESELMLRPGKQYEKWELAGIAIPFNIEPGKYALNVEIVLPEMGVISYCAGTVQVTQSTIDALLIDEGASAGTYQVAVGERLALANCQLLCNPYDASEYVYINLVSRQDGSEKRLKATCLKQDADQYDRLLAMYTLSDAGQQASVDTDYASSAYRIDSVLIPNTVAPGEYELQLYIETDKHPEGRILGTLGTLNVASAAEHPAGVSYVSEAQHNLTGDIAIGLDVPMQESFRVDNIVLTGWVYQEQDVVDWSKCTFFANGYMLMPQMEFSARSDIHEQYPLRGNGLEQEAGFTLHFDLLSDGVSVNDGDEITIKIEFVVGDETLKLEAVIKIDDHAAFIDEAIIAAITEMWMPVLPTQTE